MSSETIRQSIGNDLVLRTAGDERDVERVAAFSGEILGPLVSTLTCSLFLHHPHTHIGDLFFVEDERNKQIVSSISLIPWVWRYEEIDIPTAEMGIVSTREDYRNRGLIRAQVERFNQRLHERGYLLSNIQGIPYYYTQFGYTYALPLEGGLQIELREIPAPPETPFTFRQATLDDIPTLARLYEDGARDLVIHTVRDEATWLYLFTHAPGTETERETWIIQQEKHISGYVCVPAHHFGAELVISEISPMGFDAALATLHHARTLAEGRGKPGLRLNLPANCTLMRMARSLGGRDLGTYAWQITIPDLAALLRALSPVLERRIGASPLAGMTRDVRLSLYRETILLRFEAGRITRVDNLGLTDWTAEQIRIPRQHIVPLILGHQSIAELAPHPDVDVGMWQMLVNSLFPKRPSFLYTNY